MIDAPFAGPFYSPADPRGPDISPYLRGVKRSLSRWDDTLLPWAQFDDRYNRRLEFAVKAFQHDHGLTATGQWGKPSHDVLEKALRNRGRGTHEPAIDSVALMLMEDGYDLKHPPVVVQPIETVRASIAAYLEQCERYRQIIHYLQQRPMRSLGDDPAHGYNGDCSELAVASCYWARTHTGIHVPDPTNYGYGGYGNSDTLYAVNRYRKITGFYEVGDIAIYGPPWKTRHVTICRQRGDFNTAIFTSHGSEAGPLPTRLGYRASIYGGPVGDLLAVVRPRLVQ